MEIKFLKNITAPDQDGFGLLYKVDNNKLEIQVGRTLLSILNINADTIEELFEQFRLEPMIESIDTFYSKEGNFIDKIDLNSDGLKIKGKIHYSTDELKKFVGK